MPPGADQSHFLILKKIRQPKKIITDRAITIGYAIGD